MTYLSLILQQLIASGTHVIGKSLTFSMEPSVVLLFRVLFVSTAYIFLFSFARKRFPKFKVFLKSGDFWQVLLLGILNIPINQFLFLTSLKHTSPPNVALAYAMTPVFVLIIASIFLKEKLTWLKSIGTALAISGAAFIIFTKSEVTIGDSIFGDALAFTASFSWALYTIVGKGPSKRHGAIYVTGMGMIFGMLCYLPIFFLLSDTIQLENYSTTNWLQICYLAFMTSGVAYALWYHALTKLEASKVSVFNNLQPVLTTVLSVIFLGYAFSWDFAFGAGLILSGVFITQKG
ncbi:MAG: DMT family transporter [Candidatus Kapaibacteriales bacterium]